MGPRKLLSPFGRLLTPIADSDPLWVLYRPRLYYPASPRPQVSPRHRTFHITNLCPAGSIFDLSNLSISRESRFLAKTQGRPRTHFSPHLELIRSSEVEPFTEKDPKGEEAIYSYGDACASLRGLPGNKVPKADTLQELADMRAARERAERKLGDLQSKIKRRDREAGVLIALTVFLFVGLVFRDELRDTISKIMLRRVGAAVALQVERDRGGSLKDLGDQSREHDSWVSRDDAIASASVKEHRHRSVLSRLLWA